MPTRDTREFQPIDAGAVPRFAGIPTFMRLPAEADPAGVDIGLIGVPWDGGTTNRAGARHGPRQVRDLSSLMRKVNGATGVQPYTLCRVADLGDAPVNPIDLTLSMAKITAFFEEVQAAGTLPLAIGGDHLMTLPILRAIAKERPLGMIHFDAHSDTNDGYFGGLKYTHGTPFRRAVEEGLLDPKRVVQIGIRGSLYSADERDWASDAGMRLITMEEFEEMGCAAAIAEARQIVGEGPTYLSFDVDALDPVFAPGTGTPEIGGMTTREALRMLRGLRGIDYVGGDVVEVSPPFDPAGNTAIVGATLAFEILCLMAEAHAARRAVPKG
ncbi:MAG: agmatinase [Rhodospirillales bacterium]